MFVDYMGHAGGFPRVLLSTLLNNSSTTFDIANPFFIHPVTQKTK